jgi:hypothetical protein
VMLIRMQVAMLTSIYTYSRYLWKIVNICILVLMIILILIHIFDW